MHVAWEGEKIGPLVQCLRLNNKLVPELTAVQPLVLAPELMRRPPLLQDGENCLSTAEVWDRMRKEPELPMVLKATDLLPTFRAGVTAAPDTLWVYYNRAEKKLFTRENAGELAPVISTNQLLYDPAAAINDRIMPVKQIRPQELWDHLWLLLPPADILRFKESGQAANGGDVPLDHGIELLVGARKQLLAAACSELRPQRYHPRMSLAEADQFLQECRLGQTERSSFTLMLACPLRAVPEAEDLLNPVPFTRRVTSLLMRSLQRLSLALDANELDPLLQPTKNEPVLSANLCEGLLDMTPEEAGSTLTISVSWARTLPPSAAMPLPGKVLLRRETFGLIEVLAERLRPTHVSKWQTLFGFVDTLDGRPNADNQMEGTVILRLVDAKSDTIRARAELNATDYHTAWEAHGQHQPIALQGIVRPIGRFFRIDNVTGFRLLEQTPIPQPETP